MVDNTSADLDRLHSWFMKLAEFFLLVRPSSGRVFYKHLTSEEQDQFGRALIGGAGQIFQTHCIHLVKKTVNEGRRVDHNDLYDMLQLFLLQDDNTLFITSEKAFFQYLIDPNWPQRVLPWTAFLRSAVQSNV